ncbi:response regulator transcription factor [Variovorax boronicumulans]|uniref:response regulator transcription factor n=1 Tax=Variovorax boronicumulans TaxID=436515 RepID=UPI0033968EC9
MIQIKVRPDGIEKNGLIDNDPDPTLDTTPPPPIPLTRGSPNWLAKIESTLLAANDWASPNPWPEFLSGQPDKPVRVLLIDEDGNSRRAIAQELVTDPRVCVAGEASNLLQARRLLTQQEFDVLILDVRLEGGKGFDLIESARRYRNSIEIIVHSTLEDEVHVRRAFAAGASGYLVKNSWFQNFTQAVLQVVNGGAAVSPSVIRHLLVRLGPFDPGKLDTRGVRRKTLSAREREVLGFVARGNINREIAGHLSISEQTVCAHMKSICRKLQVHTRAHAVTLAVNNGLL